MKGKDKCELLKSIRRQVAERYGLEYYPRECQHDGDCAGTCPRCDAELRDLQRQLKEKGINDIELNEEIKDLLDAVDEQPQDADNIHILQGDVVSPEQEELEGDIQITEGMPAPPEPERKKIVFKECVVAGWNFHDLEDTWDELYEGAKLALIRERKNKHDKNAIAVALAGDYDGDPDDFDFDFILGYVPRTENEMIAKMMDMGWSNAFTAELTTVKEHGSYDSRLRMTIYIQASDDYEDPNKEKLYLQIIDQAECEEVKQDLYQKGFIYRRWGGAPVWPYRELPKENNKVAFICKQPDRLVMYLMQVITNKDNMASCFFDNPEEALRVKDDCRPFILTNVIGPIYLPEKELSWLDIDQCTGVPEHPLPDEEAQRLLDIFKSQTK